MPRHVVQAARARGSLALDPKLAEGASFPERFCAWDEDATTLAIDAAAALPRASVAFLAPGIDPETVKVALDLALVHVVSDPVALAKAASGAVALAVALVDEGTAVAALVDEGAGPDAAPKDVSPAPRMVSALRAHQERGLVPPAERIPDDPMGAYVPWGTWTEDLPARLRLVASRCRACGRAMYPPRGACPSCRGRAFDEVPLPREALVYTMTRIGRGGAPSEFALEQAQVGAFWVGIVEWPEQGVRVIARLAGFDETAPTIGQPVRAVVRRLFEQEGRVRYGVKFAGGR